MKRKNGVKGFLGLAGISNFSSIDLMAEMFAAGTKGVASLKFPEWSQFAIKTS